VHAQIVEVAAQRTLVGFGGESSQSFFVDEAPEGVEASDQDIDSEVELEVVDKVGFVEVLLGHVVLTLD
jgi:hypothetical protein